MKESPVSVGGLLGVLAFQVRRTLGILGGQLAKLNLRSIVAQSVRVAKAFGGLIS
jgi:hypothetical protein